MINNQEMYQDTWSLDENFDGRFVKYNENMWYTSFIDPISFLIGNGYSPSFLAKKILNKKYNLSIKPLFEFLRFLRRNEINFAIGDFFN